jgi:hypothetical protein
VLPGWLYIEWYAVSFAERFDLNLVENKVAATSPSILIIILDGRMQMDTGSKGCLLPAVLPREHDDVISDAKQATPLELLLTVIARPRSLRFLLFDGSPNRSATPSARSFGPFPPHSPQAPLAILQLRYGDLSRTTTPHIRTFALHRGQHKIIDIFHGRQNGERGKPLT